MKMKKFCPKCKSTNVELKMTALSAGLGAPPDWECKNCGFTSHMFPEKKRKRK